MSDVRIAPGWYDDPARPGGLRWYDGDAWTDHVSARPEPLVQAPPQTVHPAYASPPAATGTYEVRPVSAAALAPRPAPPRRRTGLVVALVAVLLAVVGIGWYAVSSLTSGSGTAPVAAAPSPTASAKKAAAVTLTTKAPAKVAGLSRARDAGIVQAADDFRAELDRDFAGRAGTRPAVGAGYGTMAHFAFVAWATTSIDDVRDAVDGQLGLQSAGARAISTSHLAGGATQVCGLVDVRGTGRTLTECMWMRPGTGVVALVESDSTGSTVSRHMKALVAALTHR